MSHRRVVVLAMSTFLAGAAASIVWGHGGDAGKIHACVNTKDGTLRIIAPNVVCKSQESALDWNIQGPEGPQGIQGIQGSQGIQGVQGPAGADGAPGAAGLSGYENLFDGIALDATDSGLASDGQLQYWTVGRMACPTGKRILGGSHALKRGDGNRLSNGEWAQLIQWGTQLATLPDGTGEYQIIVLNPTAIPLAADTTIVCANVAN